MTNFLRDLIAVSIVLGIMIFVHEWGHFIAAKLCGVRVDVFSIGFGPRLFGWKRGATDWRARRDDGDRSERGDPQPPGDPAEGRHMTKTQTVAWALLTAAGSAVGIAIGLAVANALK